MSRHQSNAVDAGVSSTVVLVHKRVGIRRVSRCHSNTPIITPLNTRGLPNLLRQPSSGNFFFYTIIVLAPRYALAGLLLSEALTDWLLSVGRLSCGAFSSNTGSSAFGSCSSSPFLLKNRVSSMPNPWFSITCTP